MSGKQKQWLTEQELISLIKEPESEGIERCETPANREKISKAICAFANNLADRQKPAVFFIGIKDKGELAGLTVTDEMLLKIASIRNEGHIQPFPVIDIKPLSIQRNDIIAVQVSASTNPPVRYKGQCWIRLGPSVRRASEEEERRLMEKRQASFLPYDMTGVAEAEIEADLNREYFKSQYLPLAVSHEVLEENNRDIKTQMRSLRLLDHKFNPTVAGILIMGKEPRNWLPGAYIQFARFEGKELTGAAKDQKEISGTLPDQIRNIEDVFRANISTALELPGAPGAGHIQAPDYPIQALSQLVRNAVIHRNYQSNTPVRVYWFRDRIEIHSPGGPYGELNKDNFGRAGLTSYRNPSLAEALKNLGFIERFGFGIATAKKALRENGNPDPDFQAETSTVLVVVKRA